MHPIQRIRELWQFREVIKNLVAQELKVKYRRSILGFFWSLLNPLLQLVVISLVFSLIFRMQNFSLYVLSGVVPWSFFASSIDGCSMSLVSSEAMLRRQYFPKAVFPISFVLQNLVTFAMSLIVLLTILGPIANLRLTPALLFLPVSFACIVAVTLGLGALAALVTAHFRDMRHLISVLLSAWFYLTPIIYPLETPDEQGMIPHEYRWYFKLNPMFAVIELFHRPIYHGVLPTNAELLTAGAVSIVFLVGGLLVFWRSEDRLIFAL